MRLIQERTTVGEEAARRYLAQDEKRRALKAMRWMWALLAVPVAWAAIEIVRAESSRPALTLRPMAPDRIAPCECDRLDAEKAAPAGEPVPAPVPGQDVIRPRKGLGR